MDRSRNTRFQKIFLTEEIIAHPNRKTESILEYLVTKWETRSQRRHPFLKEDLGKGQNAKYQLMINGTMEIYQKYTLNQIPIKYGLRWISLRHCFIKCIPLRNIDIFAAISCQNELDIDSEDLRIRQSSSYVLKKTTTELNLW